MIVRLYRSILFVLGLLGLSLQLYKYGPGMLLYYTILSNLAVTGFLGFSLYLMSKRQQAILQGTNWLRFKGGLTVMILITFIIYHFFLAPLVKVQAYWNLENFLVHYILPLGFVLDTLHFDRKKVYRLWDPLLWLGFQLAYSFLALCNGFITKWTIPGAVDSPFPYYFLNVHKYGWGFVLKNSLALFIFYLILGYLFSLVKFWIGPSQQKQEKNS
ncbi:Pr6Pr family membrane protein [Streptococcus sobrinus]|uniref:Pr6Pr family membrane protein n=1 Tax=Streptococcus sobrinus W1703 TaxID=1227275 RepID=U2IKJ7_9STRE|nr:Pr6Pr family membrane protein [Streptococcus sobrinus]ERJ74426.1 hypothetical protein HMPREF1557_01623 [Streptococcus sobrinus W1703]